MAKRYIVYTLCAVLSATAFTGCSSAVMAEFEPARSPIDLRIGNWDGMFTRALATLPAEQQVLLNTPGGASMMSDYGGYMVARYVAYNPDVPAETREQALFIVSLWQVWSDGEHGYRSNWLHEPKA